jgi:type VI secretion system secreted protein Hcp
MTTNIHLKLGDIKGESTDSVHRGEIDVLSWAWGMGNPTSVAASGGSGTGKVQIQEIHFVHHIDKASPNIMKMCATGEHLPEAILSQRKPGSVPQEYLVIKLNDVIVTSVSDSGSSGSDQPAESVALAFAKVDLEYKPQKPDGSLEVGIHFKYDIKANRVG